MSRQAPSSRTEMLEAGDIARELNVFFGGCQAVLRDPATGEMQGASDPRRGGALVSVEA